MSRYYPLLSRQQVAEIVQYLNGSWMAEGGIDDVNCTHGIKWIFNGFGDCIVTNLQAVGFAIGFASLILWLLPLIPQLWQNYRLKRCEGLALPFLIFWMIGDSCNLLGAFLTHQTSIQIIIGVYYISQDCVLMSQFVYYTRIYPRKMGYGRARDATSRAAIVVPCVILSAIGGMAYLLPAPQELRQPESEAVAFAVGRKLLNYQMQPVFNGYKEEVGYVIGSVAALCYFAGRIPQMYKNYKRKSLEGLSLSMFCIIIVANLTYGVSVILESDSWLFIIRHLPWLFSSLGCCFFDVCIFGQFFYYRDYDRRVPLETESLLGADDGEEQDHSD